MLVCACVVQLKLLSAVGDVMYLQSVLFVSKLVIIHRNALVRSGRY